MTVYIFVDRDDNRTAAYSTLTDTPDDLVAALGFDRAFERIKDVIRSIVEHVSAGRDDEVVDDLDWLNLEVYDRDHPEDLYDPTFAPR